MQNENTLNKWERSFIDLLYSNNCFLEKINSYTYRLRRKDLPEKDSPYISSPPDVFEWLDCYICEVLDELMQEADDIGLPLPYSLESPLKTIDGSERYITVDKSECGYWDALGKLQFERPYWTYQDFFNLYSAEFDICSLVSQHSNDVNLDKIADYYKRS